MPVKPQLLAGATALLSAAGLNLFGIYYSLGSVQHLSIVLAVAAVVLLFFGFASYRRLGTILLFLLLMLPLPRSARSLVTAPLQQWATSSAVFSLEMIGYDLRLEGNIINLRWSPEHEWTVVAIAEACNGLRMVTAFGVICALMVMLVRRPRWIKLLGLLAAFPIALLCNSVRLCLTSVALSILEGPQWQQMFHDYGGLAMMPLALGLMIGWLWILDHLVVSSETAAPMVSQSSQAGMVLHIGEKES